MEHTIELIMRFTRIKVFAFVFIFCLMWQLQAYAQLTQAYKNGFVAATNNGLYYLQDGFNEWVKLSTNSTVFNDSILGASFNKKLTVSSVTRSFDPLRDYVFIGNCFGYGNYTQCAQSNFNTGTFGYKTKNITNKFKNDNVYCAYVNNALGIQTILTFRVFDNLGNLSFYDNNSNSDLIYFTSFASDNDSTVVWVGAGNKAYKSVISFTSQTVTSTSISGLTSNSASAHQICHDSNNDLFWIVGLEDEIDPSVILYSYNKALLESVGNGMALDTIHDSDFDEINDLLIYSGRNNDTLYMSGTQDNYSLAIDETHTKIVILSTDNKGNCGYFIGNQFFKVDESGTDTPIELNSLPVGTIVYDLDYIDYLPCDRGIYYLFPQKNDVAYIGNEYFIKWTSCKTQPEKTVDLYRYNNGSYEYQSQIAVVNTDDSISFVVPEITPATDYVILINDGYYTYEYSDTFTINYEPIITVTFPLEGRYLANNQRYNITWTSQGVSGNVKIELIEFGSVKETITSNTTNDGLFEYRPCCYYEYPEYPHPPGSTFKIRITSLSSGQYWESGLFTISDAN